MPGLLKFIPEPVPLRWRTFSSSPHSECEKLIFEDGFESSLALAQRIHFINQISPNHSDPLVGDVRLAIHIAVICVVI
jgi:hypothetical protein